MIPRDPGLQLERFAVLFFVGHCISILSAICEAYSRHLPSVLAVRARQPGVREDTPGPGSDPRRMGRSSFSLRVRRSSSKYRKGQMSMVCRPSHNYQIFGAECRLHSQIRILVSSRHAVSSSLELFLYHFFVKSNNSKVW